MITMYNTWYRNSRPSNNQYSTIQSSRISSLYSDEASDAPINIGDIFAKIRKKMPLTDALGRGWFHDHYTRLITIHKSLLQHQNISTTGARRLQPESLKAGGWNSEFSRTSKWWNNRPLLEFLLKLIKKLNFLTFYNQFSDQMEPAAKLKNDLLPRLGRAFRQPTSPVATDINARSCRSLAPAILLSTRDSFLQSKPHWPLQQTTSAFAGVSPVCRPRTISFFVQPSTARVWASHCACAAQPDAQRDHFGRAAQLRAFHPPASPQQAPSIRGKTTGGAGSGLGGGVPLVAELEGV